MFLLPYSRTFLPLNFVGAQSLPGSATLEVADPLNKLTPSSMRHKRLASRDTPLVLVAPPSPDVTPQTRSFVQRLPPLCTRQHTQRHGCSTQLVFPGHRHLGDNLLPQVGASG